ncbi:hypothetical protein TeGR_g13945, partial [Tetraparma gracilis]
LLSFASARPASRLPLPAGVYVGDLAAACGYFGVPCEPGECEPRAGAPLADRQDHVNYVAALGEVGGCAEYWRGLVGRRISAGKPLGTLVLVASSAGDEQPSDEQTTTVKWMATQADFDKLAATGTRNMEFAQPKSTTASFWMKIKTMQDKFAAAVEAEGFEATFGTKYLQVTTEGAEFSPEPIPKKEHRQVVTITMVDREQRKRRAAGREGGAEAKKPRLAPG